jgi:hypothetical protein
MSWCHLISSLRVAALNQPSQTGPHGGKIGFGVIRCDDPGIGKTIQVVAVHLLRSGLTPW